MTGVSKRFLPAALVMLLPLTLMMSSPIFSWADSIYTSVTLLDLTITGIRDHSGQRGTTPDDLHIMGDTWVVDAGALIDGDAFADQFAEATIIGKSSRHLGLHESLSLQAVATGTVTQGTAVSFAVTQGIFGIANHSSTERYSIDFVADSSYLVDTRIFDSNLEFATATSAVFLKSLNRGSLLDQTTNSNSDVGGGLWTNTQELSFSVFIEPQKSDIFTLNANASGAATTAIAAAAVPEPSTLGLLIIGLIGLSFCHWRKKQSQINLVTQTIRTQRSSIHSSTPLTSREVQP